MPFLLPLPLLPLKPNPRIRYQLQGINPNSQPVRKKNREDTRQRKTMTRTRQYLRGSAICLHPQSCKDFTIIREEYRVQNCGYNLFFSLIKNTATPLNKNPNHLKSVPIYKNGPTKLGSTKPNSLYVGPRIKFISKCNNYKSLF